MDVSTYDVAVLGGGPAGSVTAALLARAGARVVLVERELFPRFHIGESLAPGSVAVLEAMGLRRDLEARYLPKYGVRFVCCRTGRQTVYPYEDLHGGMAWQVPRADFDELLLRRARDLGVDVRSPCTAEDVLFEHGRAAGVRVRHANGVREGFLARMVVDATGRDTLLASRVGVKTPLAGLERTALFAHYQHLPRGTGRDEGNLDVVVFPHGWIWNIPFRGEVHSVGAVCSPAWARARARGEALEGFFARTIDDAPFARTLLARSTRLTPVHSLTGFAFHVDPVAGDGWLAVGDAGGFLDPLLCSGTHLAIAGAREAATAILDALAAGDVSVARFATYTARMRHARARYRAVLADFYEGDLADTLFEARTRTARASLAAVLAGDVFPPAE